jgi:hypothetical protein
MVRSVLCFGLLLFLSSPPSCFVAASSSPTTITILSSSLSSSLSSRLLRDTAAVVAAASAAGIGAAVARPRCVPLRLNRLIGNQVFEHPHLDDGYAVTSYSSQAQTADRGLVHGDIE